jgi:hypothetical protein
MCYEDGVSFLTPSYEYGGCSRIPPLLKGQVFVGVWGMKKEMEGVGE